VTETGKPEESKPETRIYAVCNVITCFIGMIDNCIRTTVEIQ
jgi:hypothetical protein